MVSMLKTLGRRVVPLPVRILIAQRLGRTNWYRIGEGITFREAGFVAAGSPSALLVRHNYESATIRQLLGGTRVDRALEIGCGYGRLSPVISQFTDELISVDHNPEALVRAKQYYPSVKYVQASATELPFDGKSFGLVVSWTVLQHVPPACIEKAVKELLRVLEPGGVILLCEETKLAHLQPHSQNHTWHRTVDEYARLFAPLTLQYEGWIEALERLGDLGSPGRVMMFG